ncbi:MAG: 5'-nucleotidase C-terminal domain-containing protein [Alphaproteobacteria bacterium]|nr:5'-nucleotidase C-terminal domain-containing protein [Alphaproteobacteria bacterium]
MLRTIFGLLCLSVVLGLSAHAQAAQTGTVPPPDALRVLYFSSYPEIVQDEGKPGLAELATAIADQQANHDDVYFIFGGASLGPSLLGALDNGAHMIDILNGLGPEFVAVMKREFSYGLDQLIINAYASAFPMVTSNLLMAESGDPIDGLESSFLLEGQNLTIGFVTLTSANAINEYGALETQILDTAQTVTETASSLRDAGAHAVFIMADTDYDDLSLYREQGVVDGIFYTHNFGNPQALDAQGILIKEGPLDGLILVLDIWHDDNGVLRTKASTLPLAKHSPDPAIASVVNTYQERLQERLSPPIAQLESSFNTLRANVRTGENAFGNFVADAVRDHLDVDAFLLNSGAIRGNRQYQKGTSINRGDIQRELPFGNRTAVVSLSGAMLRQTIEYGLNCAAMADGCALQVSNIQIRFDSGADNGARVKEILIGGRPLEEDQIYVVGMSDFMARGNDGYDWLKGAERVPHRGAGRVLWDLIAEYCGRRGIITPTIDGRITDIRKAN